jgi:hypothetical protein
MTILGCKISHKKRLTYLLGCDVIYFSGKYQNFGLTSLFSLHEGSYSASCGYHQHYNINCATNKKKFIFITSTAVT